MVFSRIIKEILWDGAVRPVAPATDCPTANEHPPSGQQQPQKEPRRKMPGVLYTRKGEVVPAEPPQSTLDVVAN